MLALWACVLMATRAAGGEVQARADWGGFFESAGATGTIVVADLRDGRDEVFVWNEERAKTRFSPASTFKIPHALFALDSGVVTDEFQKFQWDGRKRSIESWNQDQDLRSSMRNSTVWVYEAIAKIGREGERAYLEKIGCGNADPGGTEPFWVEGNLAVSAFEQVDFLRKLYRNMLPFSVAHQMLVKDIMVVEAGRDWILRAKTGWSGAIGWWVGWVERASGPVFFALNIDTPGKLADLPERGSVARAVLESIGALPTK